MAGRFTGAQDREPDPRAVSPGSEASQFPPVSAARSTITDPGGMASTISLVIRMGAFFPGTAAVVITASLADITRAISSRCFL